MPSLIRRIWKWTAAFVAGLVILLAIGVGMFRFAVPMVPSLKHDAEALAERIIGWPIEIGEMDLRWAWLGPELVLSDVQLLAPGSGQPLITAARIDIAFGPQDLFQEGTPRPSHLRLHQPTLALERDHDGKLFLSGYALPERGGGRLEWRQLLEFGLQHGRVTVLEGELHYRDRARNIDDWTLQLSHVSLASDGSEHEFNATVVPPGALAEQVAVMFSARGAPGTPEDWQWSADIGVRDFRLEWWYRQLQWAGPGELSGVLDLAASLRGTGLEAVAGEGRLALSGLAFASRAPALQPPEASSSTRFGSLGMGWRLEHSAERTSLDMLDLAIERDGEKFSDISLSLRSGEGDYPLQVAAARLPLAEFAAFATLLPRPEDGEQPVAEALQQLRPRGTLRELALGVDIDAEPARFRVRTVFEDLGFDQWNRLPGASGLSGSLEGERESGTMTLDSRDVRLDAGELFREPLPAARLAGEFAWFETDRGWRVTGENIAVENPEATAEAQFALEMPNDAPARIDMSAIARNVDFGARSGWLPVGIMSDALIEWLDNGVLDGHAPEAKLVLRGPLKQFPFRDGEGVFDVRFRAEDSTVVYAPGWPRVDDVSADVHFHGPALSISVDHAEVMDGLAISGGSVRFEDLEDKFLRARASASGDAALAWDFLDHSPLRDSLQPLLDAISPGGPLTAEVQLDIPIGEIDELQLQVDAGLDGVHVQPSAVPWPVESLSGEVRVTRDTVSAERLEGQFTGSPFSATIRSGPRADNETFAPVHVEMQGRTSVKDFGEFVPAPWLARLAGDFDWNGELSLPAGNAPVSIDISSRLDEVTSALPAPLDAVRPVNARIVVPDATHVDAEFGFSGMGAGRLRFVDEPGGWRFDRGQVQFGADDTLPVLPDESGLAVTGTVPLLAGDAWLALDEETDEAGSAPLLRSFDIHAERLRIRRMTLQEQSVAGRRAGSGWELAVDGPVTGGIAVPSLHERDQPWQVMLRRMHLPVPESGPEGAADAGESIDPRTLPGIVLDIGDFRVGAVRLGHVSGELRRTGVGYTSHELTARAPSFDVTLDGRWEYVADRHYTSVVAGLVTRDLGDTLDALGYRGGIDADDGKVDLNVAWHGEPFSPDRALLEGNIGFEFSDGSLREVRPGAGRLLGLLSIAALPRRMMLDFSDFFGEGLHFDSITGDFLISDGNAYTTNVQLRSPSVSALLVGRTGLVKQDYDQLAIVDPDVSASIPVAGYLAAGPNVGAALLLLSQLLKAPLSDITQVKYRITGSWDDPVIERVTQVRNAPVPENR